MRTLAIETATAACSVALFDGETLLASETAVAGRGAAERLMPMIAALPGGGRANLIRVDCGPGSFTGIRTGIAAARALGFGWSVPVHGYSSLALIAATWFAGNPIDAVTVVIEGGHGEVFTQSYARAPFGGLDPMQSVAIDAFKPGPWPMIGNAASRFGKGADVTPEAHNVCYLNDPQLAPLPLYGRGADAKPMA